MSSLTPRLIRELGVPVIDPAVAALKLAETYVQMGLRTSKLAYEPPSEKNVL
jgi:Asp/Glu/hydantoin racemase